MAAAVLDWRCRDTETYPVRISQGFKASTSVLAIPPV